MPLFWLDLPPAYLDPVGRSHWTIAAGQEQSRWGTTPTAVSRFKLFVDGELECPVPGPN